ncbi:hypothetical protein PVAP13_8KG097215 [Panicum virgatum]|uniref:Uncharacterized protein n=1 Tax=Panicum virgatum TaxID=38727 RepID=A0A8T0PJ15_PANVG|nr:hypothetical protein PVAP13_8KG097215 [Panicum virgatum]
MPLLVLVDVGIIGTCDCCSRSNNGDCGDENCIGCMLNDTSSVLLHGISQAKLLQFGAVSEMFIFRRELKWCPTFSRLKTLKLTEHYVHALSCTMMILGKKDYVVVVVVVFDKVNSFISK